MPLAITKSARFSAYGGRRRLRRYGPVTPHASRIRAAMGRASPSLWVPPHFAMNFPRRFQLARGRLAASHPVTPRAYVGLAADCASYVGAPAAAPAGTGRARRAAPARR